MLLTVSMTTQAFRDAAETGKKPEYELIFSKFDGVKLIQIFGRGRYAKIEVDESTLGELEQKFSDKFIFSPRMGMHAF